MFKNQSPDHRPGLHTPPRNNPPLKRKRSRCQWAIEFNNNPKETAKSSTEKKDTERRKIWAKWEKKTTQKEDNTK